MKHTKIPLRSIILFLMSSIFVLAGCLKEGIDIPEQVIKKLTIVPSATEINAGETVSFDIVFLNDIVAADLIINDVKVPSMEFRFTDPGSYAVFAHKDGMENSDTLTITVNELGKLKLEASKTIALVGDEVMFSVSMDGEPVDDADVFVNNEKIEGRSFLFEEEGEYKVFAKKEGYFTSDTLRITVGMPEKIILTVSSTKVSVGETVNFGVTVNGEPLLEASIFVDDEKLTGNSIDFAEPGKYKAYAKKEGYLNSDTLTITVKEVHLPKLTLDVFPKEVQVGQTVSLSPKHYQGEVGSKVEGAKVYVNDILVNVVMEGGYPFIWSSDVAGTFKAYATADGYENSDPVEITVKKVPKLKLEIKPEVATSPDGSKIYSFKVTSEGASVEDVSLYKDDVKQPGLNNISFKPRPEAYLVYAAKSGYENSNVLSITVEDERPQLILIPSETEVSAGTTVYFEGKIPINGDLMTVDAQFFVDGVQTSGASYTFNTPGTYQVVGKGFGNLYKDSEPITITVTPQNSTLNVKVVGFEGGTTSEKAMLWEGSASQSTILGNGMATDIYDFYGGIYISGYEINSDYTPVKAKYWSPYDGEIILEYGGSQANSVMVEPTDGGVVVGGSRGDDAVYWMWEEATVMGSEQGKRMVITDAIWESNTGEFAVGNTIEDGKYAATIWAFGDRWSLAPNASHSTAGAVYLNGDDYYVAGSVDGDVVYWKNGSIHHTHAHNGMMAEAKDFTLKSNNTYMAGNFQSNTERHYAAVWINDNMYKLTGDNRHGGANAIAINSAGEIFVAGWVSISNLLSSKRKAMVWQVDDSGNILKTVELTDGSKNAAANGMITGD